MRYKEFEARTFAPQTTPLQALVLEYLTFTSTGIMTIVSDGAKSPQAAEDLKTVFQTLNQSNKNLQAVVNNEQKLEANKTAILKNIHDMMTYAIAHLKENMIPQEFDSKKKQINSVLMKYNDLIKNEAVSRVDISTDPEETGAWVHDSPRGAEEKTTMLPVDKITVLEPDDKFDDPQYGKNLKNIMAAIKAGKKLPPILVHRHNNGFRVIDGHHRFMAYRKLGKKYIPVKIISSTKINDVTPNKENIELDERQQQRTQLMYHGTSSKLVPSILKHGLLARSPKKTYDVDTYGAATASMGGVYVSPERGFAESIAEEAVRAHGGEPAMVTLQYVLGSGDTDEDEITQQINDAVNNVLKVSSRKAPDEAYDKYELSYPQEGWAVDNMVQNKEQAAALITKQSIQNLGKYAKVRRVVEPIIYQIILRLLSHVGQMDDYRDRWNLLRFETYAYIREHESDLLAKLMKQVSVDDAPGHDEGARRIDRDVKFKGKTRILKIEVGNRVVYPPQK